jgi:hypothetical protein
MEKILKFSDKKINGVSLDFKRYLYEDIVKIQKSEVITGVVGLR